MKIVPLILILALAPLACAKRDRFDLSALQRVSVQSEPFSLVTFAPFAWNQVYVFAPYTPAKEIQRVAGVKADFAHSGSDGHCLLVFVDNGRLAAAVEVRREIADFAALSLPASFTRENARFEVAKGPDGWPQVKKG